MVGTSNLWCGLSVLIPVHDAIAVGRVRGGVCRTCASNMWRLATPDRRVTDPLADGFGVLSGREVVGMSNWWRGLSLLIPVHDASAVGRAGGCSSRLDIQISDHLVVPGQFVSLRCE